MIKHVGLHLSKKVILLRSKVPDEDHMCIALFVDKLPPLYLSEVEKVLNSEAGQTAKNLDEELWKHKLPDDRNLLEVLHKEGHIKKLQSNQTFVTIDSINKIKLNELNDMLEKLEQGGEAAKKLAELDEAKGMNHAKKAMQNAANLVVMPGENPSELAQRLLQTADLLIVEARKLSATLGTPEKKVKKVRTAKAAKVSTLEK